MSDKQPYSSPEIVPLGAALELTEGLGSPNVEGSAGSGVYYNANPPPPEESESEPAES